MTISREMKIGLAGIVALVLLFFTIKFLQGVNLFSTQDTYYINFSNAKALAKSSPVYADGYNVGIVKDISYDLEHPGQGVIVAISVEHGMNIPVGTVAVLDEAMLGGCTLNLRMAGNPALRYAIGDTIPSEANNGLMAKAATIVPKLEQTLAKVDSLLTTLNTLASDPNLKAILENTNQLTAHLDQSSGQLNRLLQNDVPQMAKSFTTVGQNANALLDSLRQLDLQGTLARVDGAVDNVKEMTERLNSPDNNVGLLLNDTALYSNINRTVYDAGALLEDLKSHPKRYVHFSLFGKKEK